MAPIRAEARAPSGMLMASTPFSFRIRPFSRTLFAEIPLGGRSSTEVTNSPSEIFLAILDFSAKGTGSTPLLSSRGMKIST